MRREIGFGDDSRRSSWTKRPKTSLPPIAAVWFSARKTIVKTIAAARRHQ